MGITIKELSELSGFSTATISRVITDQGNVKKETKEAIEKLLIEYNYRTNVMDIKRKNMSSKMIMILTGDLDNWYYMEIIRIMEQYIREHEYIPMIAYSGNSLELEGEYVRLALVENYAGIIFMNVRGGEKLKNILETHQCPVVFLNRGIKLATFDTVCNDNYQGGYKATTYLIRKGHKKIGHLMGSSFSETAQNRRRGYEDAMRDNGLVVTANSIFSGNIDYQSGYDCGQKIIKSGLDFTALFCSSYQMTEGLLDAFIYYGLKVPEDLSLISFDETPSTKRAGVTTVCTEPEKMGRIAVGLLMNRIADRERDATTVYLETKMNERNSVKILN